MFASLVMAIVSRVPCRHQSVGNNWVKRQKKEKDPQTPVWGKGMPGRNLNHFCKFKLQTRAKYVQCDAERQPKFPRWVVESTGQFSSITEGHYVYTFLNNYLLMLADESILGWHTANVLAQVGEYLNCMLTVPS